MKVLTDQSVLWNPTNYWNHTTWSDLLFHNTKYSIHFKSNTRGTTQKHFEISFWLVVSLSHWQENSCVVINKLVNEEIWISSNIQGSTSIYNDNSTLEAPLCLVQWHVRREPEDWIYCHVMKNWNTRQKSKSINICADIHINPVCKCTFTVSQIKYCSCLLKNKTHVEKKKKKKMMCLVRLFGKLKCIRNRLLKGNTASEWKANCGIWLVEVG